MTSEAPPVAVPAPRVPTNPAAPAVPSETGARARAVPGWSRVLRIGVLAAWGPGLVVMLADTDAGSLLTAAQSGASWGYRLVGWELLLIPVLYVVQEITVRLGVITGEGHGALIRRHFGRRWGMVSAVTLLLSAVGALIGEFAGIAGVGELFGISRLVTVPVVTAFLLGLALTGSYARVERIGIAVGLAELAFVPAMLLTHPNVHAIVTGVASAPLGDRSFDFLLAANVGAVVMPWMIFYQQGAVIDKGLAPGRLRQARADTAVGAVVTQLVMIAVLVAVAATGRHASLHSVSDIAAAVTPSTGASPGRILVALGVLGAALVAAIVASLAGAWGIAEVFGWRHTLNERPSRRTAKFYVTYALAHVLGAVLVLSSVDLVGLAVDTEVMNALLLPVVLGLLLALEARALPPRWRMRGPRRAITWGLCGCVMAFGLLVVPATIA